MNSGRMQARDLDVCQPAGELQGGQPRRVQDLVRVGVTDAAQLVRVRERPLQDRKSTV